MEFFQFCLEIISREGQKINVSFDTSMLNQLTVATSNNVNYDIVLNRCQFLYRCGTINLHFAKICFKTFLLDQKSINDLLLKWNRSADVTLCSLSTGPALDYIALLHSFQESELIPPLFKNIKIITKHGAWRNTTNIVHEIFSEGSLKDLTVGKIKVLQGNPFKDFIPKVKNSVNSSDVIIMMQALNLQVGGYDQKKISKSIQVFLEALKPGAVLFCIDTEQSIKEISHLLNSLSGAFLLKPTFMNTVINFDSPDIVEKHFGCLPVASAEGSFFVWEKSVSTYSLENAVTKFSESFKCKLSLNDVADKEYCSNKSADRCNVEFTANSKSKNYAEQSNIASSFDISSGHKLINDAKTCLEYSKCSLSSALSQNVFHDIKGENEKIKLSSSRSDLTSCTSCAQTEPDEIVQDTEANKILSLTHRIHSLTAELTKILENSESKYCSNDCFKNSEEIYKHLAPCDGIHSHCPSAISCSRFSNSIQNCKFCCCQYHAHSQCCSKIKASCYGFETCFTNPPNKHCSLHSAESNLLPPAQLVIPLSNLSADDVSQIVSLLSKSKQKQNALDNTQKSA